MNLNDAFTKDLADELGINALPPRAQEEILQNASRVIYQSVLARAVELLDDASAGEFETLLSAKPDQDAIVDFLSQKVPTLDEITKEEIARFKEDASTLLGNL